MDAKIDAMEITRLKDVYGALLTDRQAEMLSLFYDFDNSLSEIAEQYGVSRQAVRDVIEPSWKSNWALQKKSQKPLKFAKG